jgi:hypothetical protein
MARKYLRSSPSISAEKSVVVEPSYQLINRLANNTQIGNLSSVLNYNTIVANATIREASQNVERSIQKAGDDSIAASGSIKNLARALQRENDYVTKQTSILNKQTDIFNSITASNILNDYQNKITDFERQDLEVNPTEEGHMDRVIAYSDELIQNYNYVSSPDIRIKISNALKDYQRQTANKAFSDEHQLKAARAEVELQSAVANAATLIMKGANPVAAIKTLDPIIASIPNSMPWKEKAVFESRNQLIEFSLVNQAVSNPSLAEVNLKSEFYSTLSPNSKLRVQNVINASYQRSMEQGLKEEQDMATAALMNKESSLNQAMQGINDGTFTIVDYERDKDTYTRSEQKIIETALKKKVASDLIQSSKDRIIEEQVNEIHTAAFLSADEQRQYFFNRRLSKQFMINGKPANDDPAKGEVNMRQAEAEFAIKYHTVELPILRENILQDMVAGKPDQVIDAYKAFGKLYESGKKILGNNNDLIDNMLVFYTTLQNGGSIDTARKLMNVAKTPMDREEVKKIEEVIKDNPMSIHALREYNVDISPYSEDPATYTLASNLYKKYMYKTRGNIDKSYTMTATEINTMKKPTKVNGDLLSQFNMMGAPEAYISPGYNNELLKGAIKRKFRYEAKRINVLDAKTNGHIMISDADHENQDLNLFEINVNNDEDSDNNPIYEKSYWGLEPIPGLRGQYHVKYARLPGEETVLIKEEEMSIGDLSESSMLMIDLEKFRNDPVYLHNRLTRAGEYIIDPYTNEPLIIDLDDLEYSNLDTEGE